MKGSSSEFRNGMRGTIGLESTNGISSLVSPIVDVPILVGQAMINGYSFFSNLRSEYALTREQITRASLALICSAQLALAIYYFFEEIECDTKKPNTCKAYSLLMGLKIGIGLFAAGVSEVIKRPFVEEEEIRALRENPQTLVTFEAQPTQMQTDYAHVVAPLSVRP